MRLVAFIGDIHGEASSLKELLAILSSDQTRHLVFLGDYVNVGRDSRGVLELLASTTKHWKGGVTFLAGNHDLALLEYIQKGNIKPFAATGGIPTIASYVGDIDQDVYSAFVDRFPDEHLKFLEALEPFFEDAEVFASHSGININDPFDRRIETMAGGGSFEAVRRHVLPKFLVCGHFIQRSLVAYQTAWSVCLDSGCGSLGGPLSALLWPERQIIAARG